MSLPLGLKGGEPKEGVALFALTSSGQLGVKRVRVYEARGLLIASPILLVWKINQHGAVATTYPP